MKMIRWHILCVAVIVCTLSCSYGFAQAPPPDPEEQAKKQEALEAQAYALLDQVISDAQTLRLPENRISIQIAAGELLWERDEVRARSIFTQTAGAINDLHQSVSPNDPEYNANLRTAARLRQELLTTVSQYDPKLAYDLLLTTRMPDQGQTNQIRGRQSSESDLEMRLLAQVAEADPFMAFKNAQELLDKGQFPNSLIRTLDKLRSKNAELADKLSDKIIDQLRTEALINKQDAGNLALSMLRSGPIPPDSEKEQAVSRRNNSNQVLSESHYKNLLQNVVNVGLTYNPATSNNNRRNVNRRGGPGQRGVPDVSEQELAQNNTRRLFSSLQSLLPQIEKYLPNRAPAVKQKLAQSSQANDPRMAFGEMNMLMREGTVDDVIKAAANAPPQMQSRLYQQAAVKAINEGKPDLASQIAEKHLDGRQRDQIKQAIERENMTKVADTGNIDLLRQSLFKLRSDRERVEMLTRLAVEATRKKNDQFALQLMDEARSLVSHRARDYDQLQSQLRVARAYADIDPIRSFEILETGIARINELLPAAAALSGFEVNIYKDGELPLNGNSGITQMIMSIGQELAGLASKDFDRARNAVNIFQYTEPRISASLSVIRGIIGNDETGGQDDNRNRFFFEFGGRGRGFRP